MSAGLARDSAAATFVRRTAVRSRVTLNCVATESSAGSRATSAWRSWGAQPWTSSSLCSGLYRSSSVQACRTARQTGLAFPWRLEPGSAPAQRSVSVGDLVESCCALRRRCSWTSALSIAIGSLAGKVSSSALSSSRSSGSGSVRTRSGRRLFAMEPPFFRDWRVTGRRGIGDRLTARSLSCAEPMTVEALLSDPAPDVLRNNFYTPTSFHCVRQAGLRTHPFGRHTPDRPGPVNRSACRARPLRPPSAFLAEGGEYRQPERAPRSRDPQRPRCGRSPISAGSRRELSHSYCPC